MVYQTGPSIFTKRTLLSKFIFATFLLPSTALRLTEPDSRLEGIVRNLTWLDDHPFISLFGFSVNIREGRSTSTSWFDQRWCWECWRRRAGCRRQRPVVLPGNLLRLRWEDDFSGPDAARLYSMAVLIAKQDRPQKLHSVLVLDHFTTGLEVSCSESGISTLAQWLLEHLALAVMGICVSKHWTESLVTTADVSLLLRTCSLVDSHRLLLVLVWRAGKEPRPGYKCFSLRKDRVGMVLDSTRHEPEEFLVPSSCFAGELSYHQRPQRCSTEDWCYRVSAKELRHYEG